MSIYTLAVNDSAISVFRDTQLLVKSPGYAVHNDKHLLLGANAQQHSRLLPRNLNHRFWLELNLHDMPYPLGKWQRHADIVHAHLHDICEQANNPKEMILAVPGSYQNDQLGLLLGICNTCSFKPIGLVDTALAASALVKPSAKQLLHFDLQLHQAVVTHLEWVDSTLQRTNVVPIAGIGLQTLFDNWARFIASECIRQTRFDPMHNASSEQELYNQLSNWLNALKQEPEIIASLHGYQFQLNRQLLLNSSEALYTSLLKPLESTDLMVVLSHRVDQLLGFSECLTAPIILVENAVAHGIKHCEEQIYNDKTELEFITALTQTNTSIQSPVKVQSKPDKELPDKIFKSNEIFSTTHILWKNKAFPLPLSDTDESDKEFLIATTLPSNKVGLQLDGYELMNFSCQIKSIKKQLYLCVNKQNAEYIVQPEIINKSNLKIPMHCGDSIILAGEKEAFTLIHVHM